MRKSVLHSVMDSPFASVVHMLPVVMSFLAMNLTSTLAAGYLRGEDDGLSSFRNLMEGNGTENVTAPVQPFQDEWYYYFIIPIISGIVGYGTNVVALKMTFLPLEFFPAQCEFVRFEDQPLGICGWQGIIPTKAAKMAAMSTDIMMTKLFDINEIFKRIEQRKAAEAIKPGFADALERIIDELAHEFIIDKNTAWVRTSDAIKKQVRAWAMEELPGFTEGFMGDLITNLDTCYDLKHMVVTEMTDHKEILNDLFLTVGANELKFIERSGFIFGFMFGLIQMVIYGFTKSPIVLPIFGFVVGVATNWIALKMIFEPIEPVFLCGRKIHGVFLQRQQEASAVFATKIVEMVLHSRNIWHYMLTGPKCDNFKAILRSHADAFTERMVGYTRPLLEMYMGAEQFQAMKAKVQDQTISEIALIIKYMHDYTDQALDLETEIREKMQALPYAEFERVLHPVFEEDELKLIIVGGALGAAVGAIQAVAFPT